MTNNRHHIRKTEKRCGSTRMRRLAPAITTVVAVAAAAGALAMTPTVAPVAQADATSSCQTVLWGFLGSQNRTICDGPVQADGSWWRHRVVWTPAHYVPITTNCYGGRYYTTCSTYGGYAVGSSVFDDETYVVTPDTVLPDEPGHLG